MTQKNSSFKFRTLVGNCCRRQAALFTLSAVAMIAALPIYMILFIQSNLRYYEPSIASERNSMVMNIRDTLMTGSPVTLVLIALAVIAGIAMFRYLHVRNQTDFFHSLPITRSQMFASHTFCGILAVVPSYLIGTALSCAVCAAYGFADAIDMRLLAYSVFAHLAGFLLVYAVTILAAIVSGHTLVSLLVCAWFQFGLLAGWTTINQLFYVLYPARAFQSAEMPSWLSPPLQMFHMIGTLSTYYYDNVDIKLSLHPFRDVCFIPSLAYVGAAVIILALCWLLNKHRKSEHTGLSIAFPIIEQPFKLYMVTVMGIACGLVFQATTMNWYVMFLGMALGALVTSCIVEIVYDLDFHSLFHRWRSFLVYAIVCAAVLGCMAMDVTHWNSTVPDREQIVGAELRSNKEGWDCGAYGYSDDDYVEGGNITLWSLIYMVADVTQLDVSTGEDAVLEPLRSDTAIDAIYDSAMIGAEAMKGDRSSIANYENQGYRVVFTLKNGKTFVRQYYMPDDTAQLNKNSATVRFSQEYLDTRTAAARAAEDSFLPAMLIIKNYANAEQSTCDTIQHTPGMKNILGKLKTESMELTQEYVAQNLPILVVRAVNQYYEEWDWNSLTNLNTGSYYYGENIEVIDIPVYACETDTLRILKQYAPELETGYGSAEPLRVTVEYWSDADYVTKDYEDAATLADCLENSYPYVLNSVIDPLFSNRSDLSYVHLMMTDSTGLDCYYYGDDDRLQMPAKAEKEQLAADQTDDATLDVIGGADGPTAIMLTGWAGTTSGTAFVCVAGLVVIIALLILVRRLRKRRKEK